MRDEIARKLVEHFKKFPIPLRTWETKDEWKYFEWPDPLTDEEGEVLCQLMPYPQHIDDIAERLGRNKNELIPLLDSLLHKTWVIREGGINKEDAFYRAQTYEPGAFEMQQKYHTSDEFWQESKKRHFRHRIPPRRADTSQPPVLDARRSQLVSIRAQIKPVTPWFRILPHEDAIPNDVEAFPSELFSHIVEHAGAKGLGVTDCFCRKDSRHIGEESCGAPVDGVCMAFGSYARAGIENGGFREVTKDEMLKIARRCRDAGLIHEAMTCEHTILICNCCPCCCGVMRCWDVGIPSMLLGSNFEPVVNLELCNGCQSCIKACRIKAITLGRRNKRPVVNLERCFGCGLCIIACPVENAIRFKRKEKVIPYFHSYDEVLHLRAQETGKMELYKDYKGERMF